MGAEVLRDGLRLDHATQCNLAGTPAGVGWLSQASAPALMDAGLCALAGTPAERALLARLEFTAFDRGIKALSSYRCSSSPASAHWFRNTIAGAGTSISEGVVLRSGGCAARLAHDIAAEDGCSILRLATLAEGDLPDQTASQAEALAGSPQRTVTRVRMRLREVLRLAQSYEGTLAGMGRHTRRNVRNARKAASAEGVTFEFLDDAGRVPDSTCRALARKTQPHPVPSRRIRVAEAYVEQAGQPFRSVLRHADGEVVSYCCGYLGGSTAFLVYQLNDPELNRAGPSLMHRAFLLEALVQRSCTELVFVHGCSGILRHSCIPMVADHYWVMRRTPASRLRSAALANLRPGTLMGKVARAALQAT